MRRREFIAGLAGAAAWPLAARAQQPAMPVVGYLDTGSRADSWSREAGFREGLGSMGFVEGRNVAIDYQYAESQNGRLPALVANLLRRPVAAIYALGSGPALTAKAATTTIPIVFRTGGDPVRLGLVASLHRPVGNLTGVSRLTTTTAALRMQMLQKAVPKATVMGLLVNPTNPITGPDTREVQDAARKLGLELHVVGASNAEEIDAAFATLVQNRAQALVINGDAVFSSRRQQLAALTVRHVLPAIYVSSDFPEAGGLMSYGATLVDADRMGGTYVGRILKGDKPMDLPVQQVTRIELIINLKTAKTLGLTIPETLLATADEVIQ
jgi:putative tryptophan/tyrosine transport system substrate-binding protein